MEPEFFPCQNFRILEEQPPERHKTAIIRTRIAQDSFYPSVQRHVSITGTFDIDSEFLPLTQAVHTKTVDGPASSDLSEMRFERVIQRALAFGFPHHSVEIIGGEPILDHGR